jgi:hypothetical protein
MSLKGLGRGSEQGPKGAKVTRSNHGGCARKARAEGAEDCGGLAVNDMAVLRHPMHDDLDAETPKEGGVQGRSRAWLGQTLQHGDH